MRKKILYIKGYNIAKIVLREVAFYDFVKIAIYCDLFI